MNDSTSLSLAEAARSLGISTKHARRLAESGSLIKVDRGLVDAKSVQRYLATRHLGAASAWEGRTAWAAIALLEGHSPMWLGGTQTSRLHACLQSLEDPNALVAHTLNRAWPRTYTAPRASLPHLRHIVAASDLEILGLTAPPDGVVDGYVDTADLIHASRTLGLREDPDGWITLRVTDFMHTSVHYLAGTVVVAALDATASPDPRALGVGLRTLQGILRNYR